LLARERRDPGAGVLWVRRTRTGWIQGRRSPAGGRRVQQGFLRVHPAVRGCAALRVAGTGTDSVPADDVRGRRRSRRLESRGAGESVTARPTAERAETF